MVSTAFQDAAAPQDQPERQLLKAAMRQDADEVRRLLAAGMLPDARNAAQHTPLMMAVSQGNLEIAAALLDAKADPNAVNASGSTPLTLVPANNPAMADLLMSRGADPLACDPSFRPALLRAAAIWGNAPLFTTLAQAAGNVLAPDEGGTTLLMHACQGNNKEIVAYLLGKGASIADKDKAERNAIIHAAEAGSGDCLQTLLDAGADPDQNCHGHRPLELMAEKGNAKGVELLLKAGAKVHGDDGRDSDFTPLRAAIRSGNLRCVQLLLDAGADPLNKGYDGAFDAKNLKTDEDIAVAAGGDIAAAVKDAARKFYLVKKATDGDAAGVKELLESGVPVDFVNRNDYTALLSACVAGKTEVAKILLEAGADPNYKYPVPAVHALFSAIDKDDAELVDALLAHGASLDVFKHRTGEPPLFAALEKSVKVVDALLAHGADPNLALIEDGETVIFEAIAAKDQSMIEHLIAGGARVNVQDKKGNTPLLVAEQTGDGAVIHAIQRQYTNEMEEIARGATSLNDNVTALKALKFRPAGGPR